MAHVAEDIISGLHDHNQQSEIIHTARTKNVKTLHNLESQAAEMLRKFMSDAQHFTADLRENVNLIFSGLSKAASNVSSTLKENVFNLSKVGKRSALA